MICQRRRGCKSKNIQFLSGRFRCDAAEKRPGKRSCVCPGAVFSRRRTADGCRRLFRALERFVHGDLPDAAEIEDRHDGVAEEHEHEHLDISGRLHVEGEPAAVGEHDLPPGQLHGGGAEPDADGVDEHEHDRRRQQVQPRDLPVFIAEDLHHGDGVFVLFNDELGQQVDQYGRQQHAQVLEIGHVGAHRVVELIGHLRDVALGDDGRNVVLVDVRDLRVGQKARESVRVEVEDVAVMIHRQEHGDALAAVIDAGDREGVLLALVLFVQRERVADGQTVFVGIGRGDVDLIAFQPGEVIDLHVAAAVRDAVDADFLVEHVALAHERGHAEGFRVRVLRRNGVAIFVLAGFEHVLVVCEHHVGRPALVILERAGHTDGHGQHDHDEEHAGEQNEVVCDVLVDDAQPEAGEEAPVWQAERLFAPGLFQVVAQKLQRRVAHHARDDEKVHHEHQHDRDQRRAQESVRIPDGLVRRQAVAVVVHGHDDVFEHRVAQHVADAGGGQRHDDGHGQIVPHQLAARIAGGAQRADGGGFLRDGVVDRDGEDEGDDHDEDVEQHAAHRLVRAHVVGREVDGGVGVARRVVLEIIFRHDRLRQQRAQKVVRQRLLGRLVRGHVGILPGVDIVHRLLQAGKAAGRDHGDVKLQRVEHEIRRLFVQSGVVDVGDQAGDAVGLAADGDRVAGAQTDVVGVHAVDGDLIVAHRERAVDEAGEVHIVRLGIDADGPVRRAVVVVILVLVAVEVFIQRHRHGLKIRVVEVVFFLRVGILFVDLVGDLCPRLVISLIVGGSIRALVGGGIGALVCPVCLRLRDGGVEHGGGRVGVKPAGEQRLLHLVLKLRVKLRAEFAVELAAEFPREFFAELPARLVGVKLPDVRLAAGLDRGEQRIVRGAAELEVAVLELVGRHTVDGCAHHALVGNVHAGHEADRQHQKQEHDQILAPVSGELARDAPGQGIGPLFHPVTPLTIRARRPESCGCCSRCCARCRRAA